MKNKLALLIAKYIDDNPKDDGSRLTQTEIAVFAGVNPATLSRYINGHVDSYNKKVMERLLSYLGVTDISDVLYLELEDCDV